VKYCGPWGGNFRELMGFCIGKTIHHLSFDT